MKYFIYNIHWRNRGDEAAIRAMLESIYDRDSDAEIVIIDNGITEPQDITQYFLGKKMVVLQEYPSRKQFIELVIPYLTKGRVAIGKRAKEFCRHMMESDIVIHGPGGPSIGEIYKSSESRYLVRLKMAERMGKKVFFYAPSAGPFQSKIRNIIRRGIYRKSAGIVVREEQSREYLKSLGIDNVTVAADSALQSTIDDRIYQNKIDQIEGLKDFIGDGEKVIGLTITDLMWHSSYNDKNLADKINKIFIEFIKWLDNKGYKAIFIPQKFNCANRDYVHMKEVAEDAGTGNVMVLPDVYCSYTQQYIISKLHLVVGMRYHSNIFAYKMKTPFISIAYEHKMSGFMELAGIEKNCIHINDLRFETIIEKFEDIENNYCKEQDALCSKYEEIIGKSKITTNKLFEILNK